jgi:hypothetical protein
VMFASFWRRVSPGFLIASVALGIAMFNLRRKQRELGKQLFDRLAEEDTNIPAQLFSASLRARNDISEGWPPWV